MKPTRALGLLLPLLTLTAGPARADVPPLPPPSPDWGRVAGKVVSQETGQPAVGAVVIVQGPAYPQSGRATTDQRGEYQTQALPPGEYRLGCYQGRAEYEHPDPVRVLDRQTSTVHVVLPRPPLLPPPGTPDPRARWIGCKIVNAFAEGSDLRLYLQIDAGARPLVRVGHAGVVLAGSGEDRMPLARGGFKITRMITADKAVARVPGRLSLGLSSRCLVDNTAP